MSARPKCGCGERAADFLAWTAGNRRDAEVLAAEIRDDFQCPVQIIPCDAYGFEIVRAAS